MKRVLFLLLAFKLVGCQPSGQPTDTATRASGKYNVQHYLVNGDTLWSRAGVNKTGWSDYYIQISPKASSEVEVSDYVSKNGSFCGTGSYYSVVEKEGLFRISSNLNPPSSYQATIDNGLLNIQSTGMDIDSLNKRYALDSLKSPYKAPLRRITISAYKRE